jgi:hypothetical protein
VEVPKVQRAAGLAVSREPVEAWISLAGGNGSRLTGFFIPGEGDSASATFQLHERLGVTDIKLNGENPRADRRVFRMLLETQEVPIMGISPSQLLWEVRQGLERSRQEHIAIPLDFYALLERIEARGHTAVAPSWKGDVDRSRVVGEDFHRVGQLVPLIMAARWTIDESVIDSMAVTLAEAASSRLVVDPVIQQERMRAAVHGLADGYFSAERRERFAGRLQGAALWLEAHIGRDEAHLAWASAEALRDPTLKPSEVCFCGLFIELQIGEYIRARMSPEMLAQAQLEGSRGAFQEAAPTDDGPRIILP